MTTWINTELDIRVVRWGFWTHGRVNRRRSLFLSAEMADGFRSEVEVTTEAYYL